MERTEFLEKFGDKIFEAFEFAATSSELRDIKSRLVEINYSSGEISARKDELDIFFKRLNSLISGFSSVRNSAGNTWGEVVSILRSYALEGKLITPESGDLGEDVVLLLCGWTSCQQVMDLRRGSQKAGMECPQYFGEDSVKRVVEALQRTLNSKPAPQAVAAAPTSDLLSFLKADAEDERKRKEEERSHYGDPFYRILKRLERWIETKDLRRAPTPGKKEPLALDLEFEEEEDTASTVDPRPAIMAELESVKADLAAATRPAVKAALEAEIAELEQKLAVLPDIAAQPAPTPAMTTAADPFSAALADVRRRSSDPTDENKEGAALLLRRFETEKAWGDPESPTAKENFLQLYKLTFSE